MSNTEQDNNVVYMTIPMSPDNNPIQRVTIHQTKVMGSWGHHGIQAPACQILWPGRQQFHQFTEHFENGWKPTEGHRYVLDIQLKPRDLTMIDHPSEYRVINIISDEIVNQ